MRFRRGLQALNGRSCAVVAAMVGCAALIGAAAAYGSTVLVVVGSMALAAFFALWWYR